MKTIPGLLLTLILACAARAQEASPSSSPTPQAPTAAIAASPSTGLGLETLEPLKWLQGTFVHRSEAKYMEEHWSADEATSMLGTFRMIADGQVKFYELMTLTLEEGRVLLRIRHYTSSLEPWEEKPMSFALREISPAHAIFVTEGTGPEEKLTYSLDGTTMVIVLDAVHEGKPQQSCFELERQGPR